MKNKKVPTVLVLISVFSLGLVSCAPDPAKEVKPFRLAAPQVVPVGESPMEWKEFTGKAAPEVSDYGFLQMGPGARGDRFRAKSQCGITDRTANHVVWLSGTDKIRFADVVPAEVLAVPAQTFNCRLEIAATNGEGSTHVFPALDFKFKSQTDGFKLNFKQDSVTLNNVTEPLNLPMADWYRYSLVPDSQTQELAMDCEFHRILFRSNGGELISLPEFDVAKAIPRPKIDGGVSRIPNQHCRLIAYSANGERQYSPALKIQFPNLQLKTKFEPAKTLPFTSLKQIGVTEIQNQEDFPVELEIPGPADQKVIATVIEGNRSGQIPLPIQFIPLVEGAKNRVVIQPKSNLKLAVRIQFQHACLFSAAQGDTVIRRSVLFRPQSGAGPWTIEKLPTGERRGSPVRFLDSPVTVTFNRQWTVKAGDMDLRKSSEARNECRK